MAYPFCSESSQNSNNSFLTSPVFITVPSYWEPKVPLDLVLVIMALPFVPNVLYCLSICSQCSSWLTQLFSKFSKSVKVVFSVLPFLLLGTNILFMAYPYVPKVVLWLIHLFSKFSES
jgi:flagellar biosynthesis protein FliQ